MWAAASPSQPTASACWRSQARRATTEDWIELDLNGNPLSRVLTNNIVRSSFITLTADGHAYMQGEGHENLHALDPASNTCRQRNEPRAMVCPSHRTLEFPRRLGPPAFATKSSISPRVFSIARRLCSPAA